MSCKGNQWNLYQLRNTLLHHKIIHHEAKYPFFYYTLTHNRSFLLCSTFRSLSVIGPIMQLFALQSSWYASILRTTFSSISASPRIFYKFPLSLVNLGQQAHRNSLQQKHGNIMDQFPLVHDPQNNMGLTRWDNIQLDWSSSRIDRHLAPLTSWSTLC